VKALAPVSLVLAFELLMGMIRAELKRANVLKSIADLKTEAEATQRDTERERQERQAELERLAAEQEKVAAAIVAEQERLEAEMKARKQKLEQSLAELVTRKEALQGELAELRKKKQWMVETGEDTKRKAATILVEMHRNGHDILTVSGAEIGRWVERSARTGLEVKKEVVPIVLQGGPELESLLDGKGVAG
jgi:predicted nuclease with TOPRIM domain